MPLLVVAAIAVLGILLALLASRMVRLWWKYRGDRVIRCPENLRPAGVRVDAGAIAARPFARNPKLGLSSCSRWPELAGCGQECLTQVAASPEGCLARNILMEWYAGKQCASCGQPFGEIPLTGVKPAILQADNVSVEWSQIPADRLPETLAAASPICFACHMGNMLVRNHPELVVNRHRTTDRRSH